MTAPETEKMIIIGSGPAGYTAALYAARAELSPLVIEGFAWGGLLQQTTDVENFPGFTGGVTGPVLMQHMRDQAERFGARLLTDLATRVELASEPGGIHRVWVEDDEHQARTVVLAMGAEHRKLGVPGEEELSGRGVSYCATCDAAFFKDRRTLIVGGGDSAMEEAIFLTKFASKVTVIHRRATLRASKIMQDKARANVKIAWKLETEVDDIRDPDKGEVSSIVLRHAVTGEKSELPVSGVFVAIGHTPNTSLFRGQVDLDETGYILTHAGSKTNVQGVFACGDVQDKTYRQAITAAGSGCMAAIDAERYLDGVPAHAGEATVGLRTVT